MRARAPTLAAAWTLDAGEWVTGLAVGGSGAILAAGTAAGEVLVLDVETGALRARFPAHAGGVLAVDLHPFAPLLATGGRDGHVRLWDLDGGPAASVSAGAPWVERVRWAPSGARLAVAAGREVLLLDRDGPVAARSGLRPSTVSDLDWSAAPEQLWSSELRGARRWDPETGAELAALSCPGSLLGIAVTRDARGVACAGQDGTIRHFRLPGGEGLTLQGGAGAKATALAWSGSGRTLAHGGRQQVVAWDFGGAQGAPPCARLLETHQARVSAVAFAPGTERLASGALDGTVARWEPTHGGWRRTGFALVSGAVSRLAWVLGPERLVAATATGHLCGLHAS